VTGSEPARTSSASTATAADTPLAPGARRLEGRVVLVTGAGTGFGAELATRAAAEGADVAVHYRSSLAGAQRTVERVEALGAKALLVQADIKTWDAVRQMADAVMDGFGRIDVLVNNVGDVANEQVSWRDLTEESLDRVLAVDVKGTLLCTHEIGSRMLDAGRGAIVNIGSTVVVRGSPRAPQYAAAKYAILGITKSYAKALAPAVRVNTFAPGFMQTEAIMARPDWQAGRGDELRQATPMQHVPRPEELAASALYLATDEAHHMTGVYMICDGGYNMVGA